MLNKKNNKIESFSMRKIPFVEKDTQVFEETDEYIEKIKILELSSSIDKWEKEILFSENGFYSLKGRDIDKKLKEFINELEKFINKQISSMNFSSEDAKKIVLEIKKSKISSIKKEMQKYEQEQLKNWQTEVFENAISSCFSRAILYKSNEDIINSSYSNARRILQLLSEKEKWTDKQHKAKLDILNSEFFFYLINSFIQDKDEKAYAFYSRYKQYLKEEDREKLESAIEQLKNNVIAYNLAKELFSYALSDSELEEEIKIIEDGEIKSEVKKYLAAFLSSKKESEKEKEKQKNIANWNELINIVNEDIDRALIYIDYSSSKENVNAKKQYIKQMKKDGCIFTDKVKFIELFSEFVEKFEVFKKKDISNYRQCLSFDDFNFFQELQSLSNSEFEKINLDYKYLSLKIKEINLEKNEDKYDFIKLLFSSKSEYKKINKKEPDLKSRNDIIDLIIDRFKENKK